MDFYIRKRRLKMSGKLLCGAGKVKITPSPELLPYMFGLIGQQYGKVHDDIYVRALCVEADGNRGLIVDFDLDKAPYPAEWIAKISEETGIPEDSVMYIGIHTHTAPLTGYRPFEGPNFIERKPPEVQEKVKEYEAFLFERMMEAVREAVKVRPAKMGYGTGECHIGANRCQEYHVKNEDGTVTSTMGIGYDFTKPCDHTLLAVKFEDAETGKVMAILTNYAVHCVAIFLNDYGEGKAVLSGDIGGNTEQLVEGEYPGAVMLWTSAPAGDVNPIQMIQTCHPDYATGKPTEKHVKGEDALEGNLIAMVSRHFADVMSVVRGIECTVEETTVQCGSVWTETMASSMDFAKDGSEPNFDRKYEIRLQLIRIGSLALVGADGELYTTLGWAIKEASPLKDTFVVNHDHSMLLNNPGYVMDDATIADCLRCRNLGRGGLPGGGTYTAPGSVKTMLQDGVKRLIKI